MDKLRRIIMDSKFVKAYCTQTGEYFALEVKKIGSKWKVVNFTQLPESDAKITASEVEQSSFETNGNLLPCPDCGNRKVGGCSCARGKGGCSRGMKYRFNCIYCDKLKIDYSVPAASENGLKEGTKITLSQGQEVVIRFADNKPLTDIFVGVGWDPLSIGNNMDVMDVDSAVVISDKHGDNDLICFYRKEHWSGCARLYADNLTGRDRDTASFNTGDDENIEVDLKRVPADKDRLYFIVNIYHCRSRSQTLSSVKNFYIRLCDRASKTTLIEYKVNDSQINGSDTGIVIGVAKRKGSDWTFKAIGKSFNVSDLSELAEKCNGLD